MPDTADIHFLAVCRKFGFVSPCLALVAGVACSIGGEPDLGTAKGEVFSAFGKIAKQIIKDAVSPGPLVLLDSDDQLVADGATIPTFVKGAVGGTSPTLDVSIRNTGTTHILLSEVTIAPNEHFSVVRFPTDGIAPEATETIELSMNVDGEGFREGTLVIKQSDALSYTYKVNGAVVGSLAEGTTGRSPIGDEKVLLEPGEISPDTELVVIIDEVKRAVSRQLRASYFVDQYAPVPEEPPYDDEKFYHRAYRFRLDFMMTKQELEDAVTHDDAVVGISHLVTMETAAFDDTHYGEQDNLAQIGLDEATFDFYDTTTVFPVDAAQEIEGEHAKVRVAVIDTGIDLDNEDLGEVFEHLNDTDLTNWSVNDQSMVGNEPHDTDGHGTSVASVISAKSNNGKGIVGIASNNVILMPYRLGPQGQKVTSHKLFHAIQHAVNSGAEVINLSLGGIQRGCDPIMGYAMYLAIQRGVVFVIAAGHGVGPEDNPEKGGLLVSPSRFAYRNLVNTSAPGCWGAYFKGALTVGATTTEGADTEAAVSRIRLPGTKTPAGTIKKSSSRMAGKSSSGKGSLTRKVSAGSRVKVSYKRESMPGKSTLPGVKVSHKRDSTESRVKAATKAPAGTDRAEEVVLAPFSNYGPNVEIAAPGTGVLAWGVDANDKPALKRVSGTSIATAQITGAVALVIAFHKARNWPYDPWLIEDILLNGTRENPDLASNGSSAGVAKGKVLHLGDIAQYLLGLMEKTSDERRLEPTSNTELGSSFLLGDSPGEVTSLALRTEEGAVNKYSRMQIQALAFFSNGGQLVVGGPDDNIQWSVAPAKGSLAPADATISSSGILYPGQNSSGYYTVTATYKGITATTDVFVTDRSVGTGLGVLVPGTNVYTGPILESLQIVLGLPGQEIKYCGDRVQLRVLGVYSDGSTRAPRRGRSRPPMARSIEGPNGKKFKKLGNFCSQDMFAGKVYTVSYTTTNIRNEVVHAELPITVPSRPLRDKNPIEIYLKGDSFKEGPPYKVLHGSQTIWPRWKLYFADGGVQDSSTSNNLPTTRRFLLNGKDESSVNPYAFSRPEYVPPGTHQLGMKLTYRGAKEGVQEITTASPTETVTLDVRPSEITGIRLLGSRRSVPASFRMGHETNKLYIYEVLSDLASGETKMRMARDIDRHYAVSIVRADTGLAAPKSYWSVSNEYSLMLSFYNDNIGDEFTVQVTQKSIPRASEQAVVTRTGEPLTDSVTAPTSGSDRVELPKLDPALWPQEISPAIKVPDGYCDEIDEESGLARRELSPFAGGSGRKEDPYRICNATQFLKIDYCSKSDAEKEECIFQEDYRSGSHFRFMDHVRFYNENGDKDAPKSQTVIVRTPIYINGNGFEVHNLRLEHPHKSNVGLFDRDYGHVSIDNLGLRAPVIKGESDVGGLLGDDDRGAIVRNSYVAGGSITGQENVGGLIGKQGHRGRVYSSFNYGTTVRVAKSIGGGLVGESRGWIQQSYSTGNVVSTAVHGYGGTIGGLVGWLGTDRFGLSLPKDWNGQEESGVIFYSFASGNVVGQPKCYKEVYRALEDKLPEQVSTCNEENNRVGHVLAGGLVGHSEGALIYTYATGNVTGYGLGVGGLVGRTRSQSGGYGETGLVHGSTASGTVSGVKAVGGLIGLNEGSIVQESSALETTVIGLAEVGGLYGNTDWTTFTWNSLASAPANSLGLEPGSQTDKRGGMVGSHSRSAKRGTSETQVFRDVFHDSFWVPGGNDETLLDYGNYYGEGPFGDSLIKPAVE